MKKRKANQTTPQILIKINKNNQTKIFKLRNKVKRIAMN